MCASNDYDLGKSVVNVLNMLGGAEGLANISLECMGTRQAHKLVIFSMLLLQLIIDMTMICFTATP